MKYTNLIVLALALVLVLTLVSCNKQEPEQPQESASEQTTEQSKKGNAPNFVVLDEDGKRVELTDFYGKPVVLNFWATWCGYCVMEMPDFNRAYAEYPDVEFLMINVTDGVYETVDKAKAYVASEGYDFDIYFDVLSEATYAYRVTGYPTTVFIDANGDVVSIKSGMISYETLIEGLGLITD